MADDGSVGAQALAHTIRHNLTHQIAGSVKGWACAVYSPDGREVAAFSEGWARAPGDGGADAGLDPGAPTRRGTRRSVRGRRAGLDRTMPQPAAELRAARDRGQPLAQSRRSFLADDPALAGAGRTRPRRDRRRGRGSG